MKKRTIIVLGAPLGRVGSSALMGLLKIANVNVGGKKTGLGHASSSNPKGHFEPPAIKTFLTNTFPGFFPELVKTPTIKQLQLLSAQRHQEFRVLLHAEFGSAYPIALKGGRLLLLPFLDNLRSNFNIKIIMMHRKPKDQIASIMRTWKKSKKLAKHATVPYIATILNHWSNFVTAARKFYKRIEYLDVQFDELIDSPVTTMKRISRFAKLSCPPDAQITNWIDPKLTHRR